MFQWVELKQTDETFYGGVTISRMMLTRKKGYGEADAGGFCFCWYKDSPLFVYEDIGRETAFVALDANTFTYLKSVYGQDIPEAFGKAGADFVEFAKQVQDLRRDMGFMLNPENLGLFHYLRIRCDKDLYVCDCGRWRHGDEETFKRMCREVNAK
jgi:hypothetical protein